LILDVFRYLEYGTDTIPSRPLFRPVIKDLKSKFHSLYKEFLKQPHIKNIINKNYAFITFHSSKPSDLKISSMKTLKSKKVEIKYLYEDSNLYIKYLNSYVVIEYYNPKQNNSKLINQLYNTKFKHLKVSWDYKELIEKVFQKVG
jgi:hypothetical protein